MLAADPDFASLIDPHLCLDRVAALLNEPPTKAQLGEAIQLVSLIEKRDAHLRPVVAYWRAVASLHGRDFEAATRQLNAFLDPSIWPEEDAQRRSILFAAWQLALMLHPRLEELVGRPQLTQPGRLVEAIDAVERRLSDAPDDQAAWSMKRILYPQLTERHRAALPRCRIDSEYVEQLGMAMIEQAATIQRGAEFLLIAAREKPAEAPRLCQIAAESLDKLGDNAAAKSARQHGLDAVRAIGPHLLTEPSRNAYFTIVKWMADEAAARGDVDTAIGLYQSYAESGHSGIETLRTLARLHEQRQDAWSALHAVARGLVYDPKDADLLARRDRYLYSVAPSDLNSVAEPMRRSIDVDYCIATAQPIVDARDADAELLAWAKHLAELAAALRPGPLLPRLQLARARLRLSERDQALPLLEDIREQRPGKLASDAEEDAWQTANRLLGDLYLDEFNRPDLAIQCFDDFRDSPRSGADTLYKLGLAHERIGDRAKAAEYFQMVLGYENHPRRSDAREALRRVQK
jgi:tetratricopeptide (TPR) repeat protein